jgi:hypothetical protein
MCQNSRHHHCSFALFDNFCYSGHHVVNYHKSCHGVVSVEIMQESAPSHKCGMEGRQQPNGVPDLKGTGVPISPWSNTPLH